MSEPGFEYAASSKSADRRPQSLAMLSGKGGSGKTVISLSMARILSDAGLKVLLIDCDTSTHGATYFFEPDLAEHASTTLSVDMMMINESGPPADIVPISLQPLASHFGFDFIPSTLELMSTNDVSERPGGEGEHSFKAMVAEISTPYDAVIFDCQAGYSQIADWACDIADRKLIVMEPDAVSSSALRSLSLQLGRKLPSHTTWQIFNKLTEEERPIYERITGGTIFTPLAPIPFDWQVRASFGVRDIPGVLSGNSAFGLGILRIMKTLFPGSAAALDKLENDTVGDWYGSISSKLQELERELEASKSTQRDVLRSNQRRSTTTISLIISFAGSVIVFLGIAPDLFDIYFSNTLLYVLIGVGLSVAGFFVQFNSRRSLDLELKQDQTRETIETISREMDRFRTLIASDPRLREYERRAQTNGIEARASA